MATTQSNSIENEVTNRLEHLYDTKRGLLPQDVESIESKRELTLSLTWFVVSKWKCLQLQKSRIVKGVSGPTQQLVPAQIVGRLVVKEKDPTLLSSRQTHLEQLRENETCRNVDKLCENTEHLSPQIFSQSSYLSCWSGIVPSQFLYDDNERLRIFDNDGFDPPEPIDTLDMSVLPNHNGKLVSINTISEYHHGSHLTTTNPDLRISLGYCFNTTQSDAYISLCGVIPRKL